MSRRACRAGREAQRNVSPGGAIFARKLFIRKCLGLWILMWDVVVGWPG